MSQLSRCSTLSTISLSSSSLSAAPPASPSSASLEPLPRHAARSYSAAHPCKCRTCGLFFTSVGTRSHHQQNTHLLAKVTIKPGLVYEVARTDGDFTCVLCDHSYGGASYFSKHVLGCGLAARWPVELPDTWTLIQDGEASSSSSPTKRKTRKSAGEPSTGADKKAEPADKKVRTSYGREVRAPKRFYEPTSTVIPLPTAKETAAKEAAVAAVSARTPSDTVQILDPAKLVALPFPLALAPTQAKQAQAHVAALNDLFRAGAQKAGGPGRRARSGKPTTAAAVAAATAARCGESSSDGEEGMSDAVGTGGWLGWLQSDQLASPPASASSPSSS